ncbi:MAG: TIGR01212 family radical SAM protein [Bacteroidales bacterium]|nr:TIGR01212 family radical SAM protein [Bacteroidales bacterium]
MPNNKPYNSYSDYFRKIFGERVQKLTLDAGFTCPNRDGTKGLNGCIFCDNNAFNPSYCMPEKSITTQLLEGIEFHQKRYRRAVSYLAYFQAYSNTYAEIETLRKKYLEALSVPNVIGLVVGTRPDCITEEICELLAELSKERYIAVEIGIESIYDKTLQTVHRGHDFNEVVRALNLLKRNNLKTGGHFIFGLPDETPEDWMKALPIINKLPLDTIKFHQLQLIKNTEIEKMYQTQPERFFRMNMLEYIQFIVNFTEQLNPDFVIERFAGEVPPRYLADANWGIIRYDLVLREIEAEFVKRESFQGKLYTV